MKGNDLLPNEMRLRAEGNLKTYFSVAMAILNQGFQHLKIVGRGRACQLGMQLSEMIYARGPVCRISERYVQALNANG